MDEVRAGDTHYDVGKRQMGFLFRMTFWFSMVLLALPLGGGRDENGAPTVGAIEALMAAGGAVNDFAGLCDRKPDVCETGRSALTTIGIRAREASRIAYETLDDRTDETRDGTTTGSVGGKPVAAAVQPAILLPETGVPLPSQPDAN